MTNQRTNRQSRVRTEREEYSLSDFESELIRFEAGSEKARILIYGDSNAGKTHLAGTLPGRTHWLVCEPGYKTAIRRGCRATGHRITDTAKALVAIDWLSAGNRVERLDWLVVDGVSTMQDRFRLGYAAEAWDRSAGQPRRARAGRNLPDKPDYFATQNFLKSWVGMLVDLPVNLLITAHAYRTDRTDNGELKVFPGFQGKVDETANAVTGLMDITGYMADRNDTRKILFRRTTINGIEYVAGDKFGKLPKVMVAPTMPKIIECIDGEYESEE